MVLGEVAANAEPSDLQRLRVVIVVRVNQAPAIRANGRLAARLAGLPRQAARPHGFEYFQLCRRLFRPVALAVHEEVIRGTVWRLRAHDNASARERLPHGLPGYTMGVRDVFN